MWFEEYDQISFEEDFVKVKYKEFIIIDSNNQSTQIDLQNQLSQDQLENQIQKQLLESNELLIDYLNQKQNQKFINQIRNFSLIGLEYLQCEQLYYKRFWKKEFNLMNRLMASLIRFLKFFEDFHKMLLNNQQNTNLVVIQSSLEIDIQELIDIRDYYLQSFKELIPIIPNSLRLQKIFLRQIVSYLMMFDHESLQYIKREVQISFDDNQNKLQNQILQENKELIDKMKNKNKQQEILINNDEEQFLESSDMTLFNNLGKINEKKISIKNSRKKGLEMFKNRESIKNNLNDQQEELKFHNNISLKNILASRIIYDQQDKIEETQNHQNLNQDSYLQSFVDYDEIIQENEENKIHGSNFLQKNAYIEQLVEETIQELEINEKKNQQKNDNLNNTNLVSQKSQRLNSLYKEINTQKLQQFSEELQNKNIKLQQQNCIVENDLITIDGNIKIDEKLIHTEFYENPVEQDQDFVFDPHYFDKKSTDILFDDNSSAIKLIKQNIEEYLQKIKRKRNNWNIVRKLVWSVIITNKIDQGIYNKQILTIQPRTINFEKKKNLISYCFQGQNNQFE